MSNMMLISGNMPLAHLFNEELKGELDNYTDQERAEDRAKLDHMLEKEASTALDPNNWAQVKRKGERVKL